MKCLPSNVEKEVSNIAVIIFLSYWLSRWFWWFN